eukprot:TRINITY_DN12961_c0_g2_i1.p1 TRINITY_DN12961_c0_g2~~TRINITY_DN12961_c0_g2_i1.p1  ORF type:complete len:851 (-),score=146.03 TRINITY_DN12961_c0_g2_i1:66-2618(-)
MSKPCEVKICDPGGAGLVLPLFGASEQELRKGLRAVMYLLGLVWVFLGVATVCDIFMGAIECITSKKRRVVNPKTGNLITVKVWNDTVANLTLMALGSSAPEIMLSVIELFGNDFYSGELGPSTIVGSAAFNLFCISAVCVLAIPNGEVRKINDTTVYAVTATCSLFAYIWLFAIVSVFSEDIIDIWEGVLTLLFFPLLVLASLMADRGYFSRGGQEQENSPKSKVMKVLSTRSDAAAGDVNLEHRLCQERGLQLSDEEIGYMFAAPRSRSKAAYRVAATRQIVGGKRIPLDDSTAGKAAPGGNLSSVVPVDQVPLPPTCPPPSVPGHPAVQPPTPPKPTALVAFTAENYAILESAGRLKLPVYRTGDPNLPLQVDYKSRDGLANASQDYEAVQGVLDFFPGEVEKEIEIVIIQDGLPEEDEDFYVDLSNPRCSVEEGTAALGPVSSARIIIVDVDEPSVIYADKEVVEVKEEKDGNTARIVIRRKNGCSAACSCQYVTEAGSATAGLDYDHVEGTLEFAPNELSAEIVIPIHGGSRFERKEEFRLLLSAATGGASFDPDTDGGADSCVITICILPDESSKTRVDRLVCMLHLDWDKNRLGSSNWKDQFRDALLVNGGGEDAHPANGFDWAMHVFTVPWKLLFAMIPPTDYCGGWLSFCVSLLMIGMVTALIADLAELVGCVLGIPDAITAISLVALGTSLPDMFASKTAAEQDPYADASVGNVTGSNSVNVFLGIGLPWTIGSIYWASYGRTEAWQQRYQSEANFHRWNEGGGKFIVIGGDLGYSVMVFTSLAFVCIILLAARRKAFGGELGGPQVPKVLTAIFLVVLWIVYIVLSAIRSFANTSAPSC